MTSFIAKFFLQKKSRSSIGWRKFRNNHIQKYPFCAVCGYYSKGNDVHHIIPRHIDPNKVADEDNLITLCRRYNCHLRCGHFGNYRKYYNPDIKMILGNVGELMRDCEVNHKEKGIND